MSDFKQKAEKAGEAIGDLASSGLSKGREAAAAAGQTITGLFSRAKDIVKDKLDGHDDNAAAILREMCAASDEMAMAASIGDEARRNAASQRLSAAWADARALVAASK